MAISTLSNGFYSRSDSYLKSMKKQDLINYIRTIEEYIDKIAEQMKAGE